MSVTILSRIYQSITRPQDLNIDWLEGNVGVWQKLTLKCRFGAVINFSTTNTLFMEEPNLFTLTSGDNWRDNGFEVGDGFNMQWNVEDTSVSPAAISTFNVFGTITSISDNIMISNNPSLGAGAQDSNIYPAQFGDKKIFSAFIAQTKNVEGIDFQPFHLKNSSIDSLNPNSFIDGTQTVFKLENTDTMTIGQVLDFVFSGDQSGMSVESCKLKFIGPSGSFDFTYEIIIIFMLSNFWDDITNLETDTPPDVSLDTECPTDNFLITGFPEYNNPNVTIKNDPNVTKRLGNVGWFNENYNGLPNDFTVSSVVYSNVATGNIVQQLDYQNTIKVTAIIDGVQNISGLTRCCYGFQWVPIETEDYKNNEFGFHQNTKMNTGGNAANFLDVFNVSNTPLPPIGTFIGYNNDGASMDVREVRFQQTGPSQITFEAEFLPNGAFAAFFDERDESDRNYILWVSVADQTLVTNHSNRVSLRLHTGIKQMITVIEPIGPYPGMSIGFIPHPFDETATPSTCGDDIRIEDDLLAKLTFLVDTAVGPTIPIITGITYGFLIERDSDGFQYEIDRKAINLSQFPSPVQYNIEESRGFKLGVGNSKNFVKVVYFPSLDTGTEKGVLGNYGFKVRWEDWQARSNVPSQVIADFFDNSKKSDGLSNDWFRWSEVAGWRTYFFVFLDAILDGVKVRYENKKQLLFKDYDQNADVATVITYKRESDGAVLSGGTDPESGLPLGVILANEPVRIIIEYTRSVGTWGSLSEVYALNTIEEREGAGQMEYRQLSSVFLPELDNPLLPIPADTLLTLTLVSSTVITAECLVDPTKLTPANKYKITGRIGCK